MQLIDPNEELWMTVSGIVLIDPAEEWPAMVGNTEIFFRRYTGLEMMALEERFPLNERGRRGNGFITELLILCLKRWNNVFDLKGQAVPYRDTLVEFVPEGDRLKMSRHFSKANPSSFPHVKTSRIKYRRILPHEDDRLLDKNTNQGRLNDRGMVLDVMDYCIQSWEAVYTWTGEEARFESDLIQQIPDDSIPIIGQHLRASTPTRRAEEAAALGNSEPGSIARLPTTDLAAATVAAK